MVIMYNRRRRLYSRHDSAGRLRLLHGLRSRRRVGRGGQNSRLRSITPFRVDDLGSENIPRVVDKRFEVLLDPVNRSAFNGACR
jgi:hypothetical protein